MEREEVIKKTLYEFKKFAREGGFWERYKTLSNPLKRKTFLEILDDNEPVELIQSSNCFCTWPFGETGIWRTRSMEWAKICLDNNLFFDEQYAKRYVKAFIW